MGDVGADVRVPGPVKSAYWIPLSALCGLLLSLPVAPRARADGKANRSDVMSVADLKPGMKGYGLTVFEGTEPGRFDVEIIDVLKNFRPRQDLILVKTFHPRLDAAKVVAGMSGSPIYMNGKMIGAYAYGWSFGAEPIAGVTPIRNMLDDIERPLPDFIHGWPLKKGAEKPKATAALGGNRWQGGPASYDLEQHRDQLAARNRDGGPSSGAALAKVATPVLMGGMSSESVEFASELLSPLGLVPLQAGGGGGTEANAPTRYVDGGAIGVQLVRGDMSAMGLGTVTRVEGDKLVAFGHPMMEGGVTALPTAVGRVLWFLASQSRSFKIGMAARPVGALVDDRQASIVVSHSMTAPTVPVHVRVNGAQGAPYTDWNFELAHEKFMVPGLLAVAIGNAIQTTAADRRDVSWNLKAKVSFYDHGSIDVEDFGVAVGGLPDERELSRSNVVSAVGAVVNNPWQPTFVESVDLEIELRYSRDIYQLRGVEVLDPQPEPGSEARILLRLLPYSGAMTTRILKLPVPKHLAGQTVKVQVRPGYLVDKPRGAPESVSELIATFENPSYPPRSVVLSYESGAGLSHRSHVALNLPPGALDAAQPTSSTLAPETTKSEVHSATDLGQFMIGRETVTLEVQDGNE
jgi:hypothetical protein